MLEAPASTVCPTQNRIEDQMGGLRRRPSHREHLQREFALLTSKNGRSSHFSKKLLRDNVSRAHLRRPAPRHHHWRRLPLPDLPADVDQHDLLIYTSSHREVTASLGCVRFFEDEPHFLVGQHPKRGSKRSPSDLRGHLVRLQWLHVGDHPDSQLCGLTWRCSGRG